MTRFAKLGAVVPAVITLGTVPLGVSRKLLCDRGDPLGVQEVYAGQAPRLTLSPGYVPGPDGVYRLSHQARASLQERRHPGSHPSAAAPRGAYRRPYEGFASSVQRLRRPEDVADPGTFKAADGHAAMAALFAGEPLRAAARATVALYLGATRPLPATVQCGRCKGMVVLDAERLLPTTSAHVDS